MKSALRIKRIVKKLATNDILIRFKLLTKVGRLLVPNYRFKWPQMEWWNNIFFTNYLTMFDELHGMNSDRRWMQYQLMRLTSEVPGDTAECGVYTGAASYLICKANSTNQLFNRNHHMFDSFDGLSKPLECDGAHWTEGDLSCSLEIVNKKLAKFDNIHFYKGWIPSRFSDVEQLSFSFVHIDVDLYQPTIDSITFFYPRMNKGGVIICDDYGCTTCPGATKAIDSFLRNKDEKMISLSGGGGFFIKGVKISN